MLNRFRNPSISSDLEQRYRNREFRTHEKRRGGRRIYRVKRSAMVDILSTCFQSSRPGTAIRSCRFFLSSRRGLPVPHDWDDVRPYRQGALGETPAHFFSPQAHLRLTPAPALVAHAQGGLTLGPAKGEVDADFTLLGSNCLSKGSHRVQTVALLLQTGDIFICPRTRSRYIGICISIVAARTPEHD